MSTLPCDLNLLVSSAQEQVKLLTENYSRLKYEDNFSLWGLAFYGDRWGLKENHQFIPKLLEWAGTISPLKVPDYNVPRRSDSKTHYTMFCLYNQPLLEDSVERLLDSDYEPTRDILSERRLFQEAAQGYLNTSGKDFIEYLLYFERSNNQFLESYGSYAPMLKRLLFRFGEGQLESQMFTLLPPNLSRQTQEQHEKYLYGRSQEGNPEIRALYDRRVGNGLTNGHSEPAPPRVGGIFLPGKRRVLSSGASVGIDWSEFLDEREKRIQVCRSFNKEELMRMAIRQSLINECLLLYQQNPEITLNHLQEGLERSSGIERDIFREVLDVYQGIVEIANSPTVGHTMNRR